MKRLDNDLIEKTYDAFSQIPLSGEIDEMITRATANSPHRSVLIDNLGIDVGSKVLDIA